MDGRIGQLILNVSRVTIGVSRWLPLVDHNTLDPYLSVLHTLFDFYFPTFLQR